MREHINFEAIECDDLLYMNASKSYVCLRMLTDLDNVDDCMQCKFSKLKAKEDKIRALLKGGVTL